MSLTQKRLKELLEYSPETGLFHWKVDRGAAGSKAGDIAGGIDEGGYVRIKIDGKKYRAHRLAWFYMTGEWPLQMVDHKDTVRNNNRWENLRAADLNINAQNRRVAHRNNKSSGLLGVHRQRGKKFISTIHFNGRNEYLGSYATPELAHAAYLARKGEVHPGSTL